MLQTDDVDEDYFTPVQSTSLANIFGETSKKKGATENESLKYTPPRQQNVIQKADDAKLTQCILACVVTGHEWFNQAYVTKGELGLAIIKNHKTDTHNIILYDSNKTTLSCTLISMKLEVTVNANHILYYDNLGKYWCVYATEEDITKIVNLLKSLNVTLKQHSYKGDCPPNPSENLTKNVISDKNTDVGSDTDSSVNRKTKSSILNRMAMMGHSVLPPQTNVMEKTSDSSDNNDCHIQTKIVRHKPIKNMMKRNLEKNLLSSEPEKIIETQQRMIVQKRDQLPEQNSLYTNVDKVLMPVHKPGVFTKSVNEFDIFVSEQRISNSELRINLNRLTDKIDHMAEKVNNLHHKDNSCSSNDFQTEILQKLLLEYENKIRVYENYFKSKGVNETYLISQIKPEEISHPENKIEILENKIKELNEIIDNKDNEITKYQSEIQLLLEKVNQQLNIDKTNADLLKRIADLEQIVSEKNEDLLQISKNYENVQTTAEGNDIEKLKIIMNETYSIIANNIDNDEMYKGEIIKKTIASVIRRVTNRFIENIIMP